MQHSTTPPDEFVCPLTLDIMRDPVLSRYGHNFERSAILSWMAENDHCPLTRKPLRPSGLISNKNLKRRIGMWKRTHGYNRQNDASAPPREFICPLSHAVMVNAVITIHGVHFSRDAIQEWFNAGHEFCPCTGKPLRPCDVHMDTKMTCRVHNWMGTSGYAPLSTNHMKDTCYIITGGVEQ